jgi:predicted MFS family arabinose efflux permease
MKRVIALVAALQFVYILDFVMVLPLGPDLARALGFAADRVGALTAAYTLASLASGLILMRILDGFDRKTVLLCGFGMLSLATLASGFAHDLPTLLLARGLTGFAGAPAIAAGMAMIIDMTPPADRGRTIAKVMIGFPLAAIAGIPMALELSRIGGWQLPFHVLAGVAALVWLCALWLLPSARAHAGLGRAGMATLLRQPAVRDACLVQALSQFSAFLLIPHIASYFLLNLGFPRDRLGLLYVAGGVSALFLARALGRLADRAGSQLPVLLASACMGLGLLPFFAGSVAAGAAFVLFMAGNAGRNVSLGAALSHVPAANQRAAFMALQSMVQDLAIAAAALTSGVMLTQQANGQLGGMPAVAILAALAGCGVLWALMRLSAQQVYSRTIT